MKLKKLDNKGVSLPLVVGLIVILMIASASIFLLISRSFKGIQRIEASTRAYFAAESGTENALYELSSHFSGYQTPPADSVRVRRDIFEGASQWQNQWWIESMDEDGDFEGQLRGGEKVTLSFYRDISGEIELNENYINSNSPNISQLDTSGAFNLTFQIPFDANNGTNYSQFFINQNYSLRIDNDGDLGTAGRIGIQSEGVDGLNEDSRADTNTCGGSILDQEDGDCDGRQNEDSLEDTVILWQFFDSEGNILSPTAGCLTGDGSPNDPTGSEICEKDFELNLSTNKIEVQLNEAIAGMTEAGTTVAIRDFLMPGYNGRSPNTRVEMELLITSPMAQVDANGNEKGIPYFEYLVNTDTGVGLPLPYFNIQSDGWDRGFKQSITTKVTPQSDVPLLDITIIQNQ